MSDKPVTRRGLLAALSSVYEPLGLGAPFLLKGFQTIQNLCSNNLTWDELINYSNSYEWLKWRNQLMTLQDMNITRSIRPKNFGEVIHCSLHYFSDPCETGYALSAYIRLANAEGAVNSPCYLELHQAGLCSSLDLSPQLQLYLSRYQRW